MSFSSEIASSQLTNLLSQNYPLRAHAMGIGGVGVAGLAALLHTRGWQVSGCDRGGESDTLRWLRAQGVAVVQGHAPAHLAAGCDLLIHSSAIAADEAEIAAARAAGIVVVRRGELLALLHSMARGVAVCGSHGKTTTACFTVKLLQAIAAAPSWCIGGATATMGALASGDGRGLLVVEADESDGTLALYRPEVLLITNIEADHLDHFGDFEALRRCFGAAAQRAKHVVFCADDSEARKIAAGIAHSIGYGFAQDADLRIEAVEGGATEQQVSLSWRGRALGSAIMRVAGRHNALNATGALAALIALGYDPDSGLRAFAQLDELPARRFQEIAQGRGVRAILDYAHHPTEIAALVAMARLQGAHRLIVLFQPHRYSRTRDLAEHFPAAFRGVNELILAPIYAASEAPLAGGSSEDLAAAFRKQALPDVAQPRLAASLEEAWQWLQSTLRAGDLLLIVGAGDVAKVARWVAQWSAQQDDLNV